MYVVIFRARVKDLDSEYFETASRMREIALNEFGCLEFHAVSEDREEVALSYWPDLDSIRRWKSHPEHVLAQRTGQEKWYESYKVQISKIERQYAMDFSTQHNS